MALLEVNEIHAHYGGIEALKGVSLSVDEGEVVTLIGSNGAGKSTTLRAITGLTPASSGSVVIDGEDVTRVPAHEIVDRGIALSPEGRHCFPRMTVRENLDLGAYRRRKDTSVAEDLERVFELFPRLQGAREAEGRHDVRRRTADARDGPRADGQAQGPAARRAVDGHRADSRAAHLRDDRRDQPRRDDDPARRAERQLRVGCLHGADTCSRPAASCSRANPTSCARIPRSSARTWEPELDVAILALIGVKGLYLLFAWLLSAAIGAWMTERKGYGERVGLAFGLLLTVVGLLFVLLLPGRPGSLWKTEGRLPRRKRR